MRKAICSAAPRLNIEERTMTETYTDTDLYSLPTDEAEQGLRVQLAAAYRMVDYYGWTEQIYGHLTARVPGPEAHFLINPFGLNYDEVTASNLVKIDCDGEIVEGEHPVNRAGFVIHSAVHMAKFSLPLVLFAQRPYCFHRFNHLVLPRLSRPGFSPPILSRFFKIPSTGVSSR